MATIAKIKKRTPIKKFSKRSQQFHLDGYDGIYSQEELEILKSKGKQLFELAQGNAKPQDAFQRRFIGVLNGDLPAFSISESAWIKFTHREKIAQDFREKEKIYMKAFHTLTISDLPFEYLPVRFTANNHNSDFVISSYLFV
jgi:uncharacterized protein YifE (UPF0438 family)